MPFILRYFRAVWAWNTAFTDHDKSPGQQRSGSLSKLSVMTLMPGLLLSVSGRSVSSPALLKMHWAAAATIHLLLAPPRGGGARGLAYTMPGYSGVPSTVRICRAADTSASETHSATLARDCWKWFSAAVCWDYRNLYLGCVWWLPQPLQRFPLGLESTRFMSITQQLRLLQQIVHVVKTVLCSYKLLKITNISRNQEQKTEKGKKP